MRTVSIIVDHYQCVFTLYRINAQPASLPVLGIGTLELHIDTGVTAEIHYQADRCIVLDNVLHIDA